MKLIILCDRYNKDEPIIKELDFTIIRNVLNKYNSKNLSIFLNQGANAFLFINFFKMGALATSKEQKDVDSDKLFE